MIKQKKKFAEIKKLVVFVKRSNADAMRDHKRIARIEKIRFRKKMKIIKQIEIIDRKQKREKIKIQKKLKRAFRFKRIYRKILRDFQNQMKSSIILMNSTFEKKK